MLLGMQNDVATMENSLVVSDKIQHIPYNTISDKIQHILYNTISLLGILLKIKENMSTLFVKIKKQKQNVPHLECG